MNAISHPDDGRNLLDQTGVFLRIGDNLAMQRVDGVEPCQVVRLADRQLDEGPPTGRFAVVGEVGAVDACAR